MYFHTRLLTQCSLPAHRKLSPPCFSASGPSVLNAMEDNTERLVQFVKLYRSTMTVSELHLW